MQGDDEEEIPMPAVEDENGTPVDAAEIRRRARRTMRRRLMIAVALGALSAGVSIMAMIGQSFSLRQARAMEAIQHQLEVIADRLGSSSSGSGSSTP